MAAVHEALAKVKFEQDVAALTDMSAARQRLIVHTKAFPTLDVTVEHTKPIRFRMHADNWDDLPPSVAVLEPDGSPWKESLPGDVFNSGPHPATGQPFICMRGVLEYHTNSGHMNEKWDQYRGNDGMGLVGILMQLTSAWRRLAK